MEVTAAVMADVHSADHRAVIVDSPPGAGKSTFVVQAAAELAESAQVPIVAQTNAQADDLVEKLRSRHPGLEVGRLTGSTYDGELVTSPGLIVSNKTADVAGSDIVISTSSKWGYVDDMNFRVGIIDEAYQMRSDQLLYVADLFPRALLVGDPGQLDPFTPVDDSRWRGQADGPVTPAVATVRHNHPEIIPHRLPVSWRLSAHCAPLVSNAFYPDIPFSAGTSPDDRSLTPMDSGGHAQQPIVTAIEMAAGYGWAHLELPTGIFPAVDHEAVDLIAQTVIATLAMKLHAVDSADEAGPVDASRIAVGVAHRNQRSAVRIRLDELGTRQRVDVSDIVVDTANRLQGREFHLMVVLHPLSGRATASEFHLETGRLCVLLSRHRHACIVVSRAGISDVLDAHPMSRPIWLGAPIPVPDGWEANQQVLEDLAPYRVPLRPDAATAGVAARRTFPAPPAPPPALVPTVETPTEPPVAPTAAVVEPHDDLPFEQRVFDKLHLKGIDHPAESEQLVFTAVNQREGEHVRATALLQQDSGEPRAVALALLTENEAASPTFVRNAAREVMKDGELDLLLVLAREFKPQVVDVAQSLPGSSALVVIGSSWLGSLRVLFVRVEAEVLT